MASVSLTFLLMKTALPGLLRTFSLFLPLLFSMQVSTLKAQTPTVQDCMGAIPVCQDIYVEENAYSGDGEYPNEIFNPSGDCTTDCPGSCLDGEKNSVWYVFTVQSAGILRLTIDPMDDSDDYDWAVYDISTFRCSDIYTKYSQMQRSCNAFGSQSFNGNTGINTANGGTSNCSHCGESGTNRWNLDLSVLAGKTYVLVIENWSSSSDGYTLDFGASTASIYDDVRPELDEVLADEINCGSTEIIVDFSENVKCETVNPGDFAVDGPGGPYTVLDVQGEVCLLGGEMEKRYTLIIDRAINSDGDYSVQLRPFNMVSDACGNLAIGNTIIFTVDLGAPVISESGIEIDAATCGLSNGSITGLQITGTPPYTYLWTNADGDTVGYNLDLLNIPTGDYYLRVSDQNTCRILGGPYFVDQTGAPAVNSTGINIIDADWGANNGHITGLVINGNEPLTYLWTNEAGDSIGNTTELHDIFTGNYFLLVTDTYGCDTLAGPYFVNQIGGPIGVQAAAHPPSVCAGESSQLAATAFGGAGNYSYQWISDPPGFTSPLQSPTVYPEVTTSYTVTISDGYNVTSSTATVIVNPLPVANAGVNQTINFGTSTTLSGSASVGPGPYKYYWEPADSLINPNAQTTATRRLYASTVFSLRAEDQTSDCISLFDTVIVSLSGGPLGVTLSAQGDTICQGENVVITALGFGGNDDGEYTFVWFHGADTVKRETDTISTLVHHPDYSGVHTYGVRIYDGFNNFVSTKGIYVAPTPFFTITGGPQIIACPADTVLLETNFSDPGGTEYYWSNGSTDDHIQLASTGIGYSINKVTLHLENSLGCSYTDTITVIFDFAACFGIEEYESFPSVKVYPNPTPGKINIEFENGEGFSELQVLNQYGAVILNQSLDHLHQGANIIESDLSAFPSGIYLLRAIHERFIHYQKVILK